MFVKPWSTMFASMAKRWKLEKMVVTKTVYHFTPPTSTLL